jgi:histidyl-tRNA synthetase
MKKVDTKVLAGFMELLPEDQFSFDQMKDKIKLVYERFGFVSIDTPVIEKSEVLLAKAGGETEKQIYRFMKGKNDLSLRFDLTVPLARYVSEYFNELNFPFKRYHIGKVYRGEKSQRGRFREFYQCDIDIIGNNILDLVNDAEILSVINTVFQELNIGDFTIRINNRKLISGLLESFQKEINKNSILQIIDKIEKASKDEIEKNLLEIGLEKKSINQLINFIGIKGDNNEVIESLNKTKIQNQLFKEGVSDLTKVVKFLKSFKIPEKNYCIDLSIARGLDYYTGTVYETKLNDFPKIGSICSGGRYDDLASFYTDKKLPGVGISIGLTRLFYTLKELDIIKTSNKTSTKVIIIPYDEKEKIIANSLETANVLRQNGINTEIYLENGKLKKKMNYANKRKVPYIILVGKENDEDKLTLKKMDSGEQIFLTINEILEKLMIQQ